MKMIVGLGNIGSKYDNTYHNIGFFAVDKFAKVNNVKIDKKKNNYLYSKLRVGQQDILLIKPTTFMNLSGDAVLSAQRYFKIKNEDIVVVLDDIDLARGKIRYREGGSAGTHNGLRDIVNKVGQTKRVRIGVGRDEKMDLADFVLSKIKAEYMAEMDEAVNLALTKIMEIIK